MDTEQILTDARMVLKYEVVTGSCRIKNGRIRSLDSGPTRYKLGSNFVDLHHDYLLPGLIEIHTDHLESQFQDGKMRHKLLGLSLEALTSAKQEQILRADHYPAMKPEKEHYG